MQISTTARHCELGVDDKAFVQTRLAKFEKFAHDIHEARLIVTQEKHRHIAEITLRLNAHEMVSREEAADARIAIDLAADRLEHQLRKLKEKRVERHREARGTVRDVNTSSGSAPDGGDDLDLDED